MSCAWKLPVVAVGVRKVGHDMICPTLKRTDSRSGMSNSMFFKDKLASLLRALFALWLVSLLGACVAFGPSEVDPEDDRSINRAVSAEVSHAPVRGINNLRVHTEDGVVTLSGDVPTPAAAGEVVVRAEQVPGVTRVISELNVQGADQDDEQDAAPTGQPQEAPPGGGQ